MIDLQGKSEFIKDKLKDLSICWGLIKRIIGHDAERAINIQSTGNYQLLEKQNGKWILLESGNVNLPKMNQPIVERMEPTMRDFTTFSPVRPDSSNKKASYSIDGFDYLLDTNHTGLIELKLQGQAVRAKLFVDEDVYCVYDRDLMPTYLVDRKSGKVVERFKS